MSGRRVGRARPARRHRGAGGSVRAVRRRGAAAVQASAEGLRGAGEGARLRMLYDVRPRRGAAVRSVHGALRLRLDLPAPAGGEQTPAGSAGGPGGLLQRRVQEAQQHSRAVAKTR